MLGVLGCIVIYLESFLYVVLEVRRAYKDYVAYVMMWECRAPLHEECPQHHGPKGDSGVTPKTCRAVGKGAQVIQMWVRAPIVGNASHP